jgi:sodium transport system permease protein
VYWRLDPSMVRLILGMELRTLMRSRRTIIMSIVLPIVIMPIMIFASQYSVRSEERRAEETLYRYAWTGDWSDTARRVLQQGADALRFDDAEVSDELQAFLYEEVWSGDPEAEVRSGDLHFYLNAISADAADEIWNERARDADEPVTGAETNRLGRRQDGTPAVQVWVEGNRAGATAGAARMRDLLAYSRRIEAERVFAESGIEIRFRDVLPVEELNRASEAETSGLLIGRFITLFLFMLTLAGGSVVAMDIIAGEKERGTLETLLTTAAGRSEIIAAKQLVILGAALTITLIQVANLLLYTQIDLIPLPESFVLDISVVAMIPLLLLYVPLAVMLAGMLLLLSTVAKSYKEAQLYFFPLYLIGLVPAAAGAVGDIPLRSAIALVPIANISVAAREVLSGHTDWLMIGATVLVNCLISAAILRYSTDLLGDENVVTAQQTSPLIRLDGAAAYRAQVWKWWVVIWAVFIAGALSFTQLRSQILVNQLVTLLGVSILIIRWHGLDTFRVLGLKAPRWEVWPLFLLMIGPLHVTAGLVTRFANTIFPVPQTYLEQLNEQFAPLADLPAWQAILLIAILPGVCEEIAFRGTLFYGLERKFQGFRLALAVGLVFGFFHFDLSRIIMAGTLGMVLAAARILTGSIFPGLLLHIGNNALAYGLGELNVPVDDLDPLVYLIALASIGLILWIVYTNRERREEA